MKKLIKKILTFIMRKKGFSSYYAIIVIKAVFRDFFNNNQTSFKEKIWAYRRGFLSSSITDYGLTDTNYNLFISDFDYYKLYPINGEFRYWIDDKLTTRYILQPFKEYLPKYYYHIKAPGVILPLIDVIDEGLEYGARDIIDLLKEEGQLALKLTNGSFGMGFYKLSYSSNDFYLNGKITDEAQLIDFLSKLENYIVTEYITAHSEIRKIYSNSPNALRVMVINEDGKQPVIANALIRFGTKCTGVIDNATCGAVFSIVDVKTGRFYDGKRKEDGRVVKCEVHPDTKLRIEGVLPNWELIKTKLIEISRYLSEITYMGFDIAITEDGFKILEINSHQGLMFQNFYPLLVNNGASMFFKKLLSKKAGKHY